MVIKDKLWLKYITDLRRVNDAAAGFVMRYLETNGIPTDRDTTNALIEYANAISSKYSEASAALAAEMYEATAALSGVIIEPAVPAATPEIGEVAKTVVGTAKLNNEEILSAAIGRLVKQTGVDTTMQNALRDGAEWAWIPHGETCAFCIMLASNGWQRASKKALKNGHAEHIHANCDCTYAVRFDTSSEVAGYRPEEYREIYDNADGRTGRQKLNSMRREFYARNKEVINEQKRDAYAKRAERESSAAEEMNA